MAELLLRAHLERHGLAAHVHSAGTMAWDASPPPEAVAVMRELDHDLSTHRSRPLDIDLVEQADLVLGMTRDHVGRVLALVPDARDRTFLVSELVRLGERVGWRERTESVRGWLRRVSRARPDARVVGRAGDEVTDPLGEPLATYRATAARLDTDLARLARLLAGP